MPLLLSKYKVNSLIDGKYLESTFKQFQARYIINRKGRVNILLILGFVY